MTSRLVWGLRGYRVTLVFQTAIATCWYAVQMVFGYLVRSLPNGRFDWFTVSPLEGGHAETEWSPETLSASKSLLVPSHQALLQCTIVSARTSQRTTLSA